MILTRGLAIGRLETTDRGMGWELAGRRAAGLLLYQLIPKPASIGQETRSAAFPSLASLERPTQKEYDSGLRRRPQSDLSVTDGKL